MIRRPPRSTRVRSSAASDVYKRQVGILGSDLTRYFGSSDLAIAAARPQSHTRSIALSARMWAVLANSRETARMLTLFRLDAFTSQKTAHLASVAKPVDMSRQLWGNVVVVDIAFTFCEQLSPGNQKKLSCSKGSDGRRRHRARIVQPYSPGVAYMYPNIHGYFLWPTRNNTPDGISIGLAIFALS